MIMELSPCGDIFTHDHELWFVVYFGTVCRYLSRHNQGCARLTFVFELTRLL